MRDKTRDVLLCSDCGILTANGTDGWGTDDDGVELGELHLARMVAWDPYADLVLSGCPEGDACEFEGNSGHECRFDRDFSPEQCDGCGSIDSGFRFSAVEFVRVQSDDSDSDSREA